MTRTRRQFLGAAGTAAALVGCLSAFEDPPPDGFVSGPDGSWGPRTDGTLPAPRRDWPTFQYDHRNAGIDDEVSQSVGRSARVAWRTRLTEDEDSPAVFPPSLHGDAVFVPVEGDLVALDARMGAVRWRLTVPDGARTAPTVTRERVFVGTARGVVAVDRAGRAVDWQVTAPTQFGDELGIQERRVTGAPTVVDGRVFAGTAAGHLLALDAATGEVLWSHVERALPEPSGTPSGSNVPSFAGSLAAAGGLVLAGNDNGRLSGFDAASGERRWRVDATDAGFEPAPTVRGDTVYAASGVEVVAAAVADGAVRWRWSDDPGSVRGSPVATAGTLYVASGESYGSLAVTALGRRDRSVRWRVDGRPQASPSAGPSLLYVPLYGDLVAIDRAAGEVAWRMTTRSVVAGPPIVTDGAVIVADRHGRVYGIGAAD